MKWYWKQRPNWAYTSPAAGLYWRYIANWWRI